MLEARSRAVAGARERQWPAVIAFWTASWLPATTARRTLAMPMRRAFMAHVAAVVGVLLAISLVAWTDGADTRCGSGGTWPGRRCAWPRIRA